VKLVTAKLLSQKPDDSVSLTLLDTVRKKVFLNKDLLYKYIINKKISNILLTFQINLTIDLISHILF